MSALNVDSAHATHLVVLDVPASTLVVLLLPFLVLRNSEEGLLFLAFGDLPGRSIPCMAQTASERAHLDNGRDELDEEVGNGKQRREEVVEEVDDQALDMRAVVVLCAVNLASELKLSTHLIGHDHKMTIAKLVGIRVDLVVLEAHDLLDGVDLGIVDDHLAAGVSDVEQLASKREDAPIITTDDAETGDGQRFGRVTFGQDEGALFSISTASVVGVFELGETGNALSLGAVRLLQCLCGRRRMRIGLAQG